MAESLKKNREFRRVYAEGKSRANRFLVMLILENGMGRSRLGISVSKTVGNSVVRHRVSRLIRESYRLNEHFFKEGYDIVVIARASAGDKALKCIDISGAMLHLAGLHNILQKSD